MSRCCFCHCDPCTCRCCSEEEAGEQRHVHEIVGSVMIAEPEEDPHNHRFSGVSGEAISIPGSHVHDVDFRTDFYEDHFHRIVGRSGPAIAVGDRHVHFIMAQTTVQDDHFHEFRVASLIEDPIGD